MDIIEQNLVAQILPSYGVTAEVTKDFYFPSPHPIDEILSVASERMAQPIDLLVSEQGAPRHFFLRGFNARPVIYSARYIALSERINRLFDKLYIADDLCRQLAEGMAFEAMSEFFLLEHDPQMATLCFMKARVAESNVAFTDTRALLGVGSDLWSSASRSVDEIYVADMFFGLAHEIGHVIQESGAAGSGNPPWCSDDRIRDYLARMAAESTGDAGHSYRAVGPSAILDLGLLRHEAGADIEACRILARAAPRIIKVYGEPDSTFDLRKLIVDIQTNYLCLAFLSGCQRTVAMAGFTSPNPARAIELLQQPIAFGVRQMLLQDHLMVISGDALIGDGVALAFGEGERDVALIDHADDRPIRMLWAKVYQGLMPFATEIDAGLSAAINFFNQPIGGEELADLVSAYRRGAGPGISMAQRQFEGLARSMALPESELVDLAGCLERVAGPI